MEETEIKEILEKVGIFGRMVQAGPMVSAYDLLTTIYLEIKDCKDVEEAKDKIAEYMGSTQEFMKENMKVAFLILK